MFPQRKRLAGWNSSHSPASVIDASGCRKEALVNWQVAIEWPLEPTSHVRGASGGSARCCHYAQSCLSVSPARLGSSWIELNLTALNRIERSWIELSESCLLEGGLKTLLSRTKTYRPNSITTRSTGTLIEPTISPFLLQKTLQQARKLTTIVIYLFTNCVVV